MKLQLALISFVAVAAWSTQAALQPVQLRCEYAADPLGVDVPHPRLFWKLESPQRGQYQTAYEVIAASSANLLTAAKADLWRTGRVESSETTQLPYAGRPLASSQQVFWKVRVWDQDGRASRWSQPATWTMGLLQDSDWQAKWITAEADRNNDATDYQTMLLRREFSVRPNLRRAIVHVCGLGQYELCINGIKAGDEMLSPGWTKYDKTCLYDTREVTRLLRPGPNALGLLLGNGMYNVRGGRYTKFKGSFGPLKAIAQVLLEYSDGTKEAFGTDQHWRVAPGPITFSCIYGGEDYDARLEPAGWSKPQFDDSGWKTALVVDGPGGKLRGLSCAAPAIKTFEKLRPTAVKALRPGVALYDFGQNASVMPRLTVKGDAGGVVRLTPAELVKPDGTIDRRSCGGGEAYWQYTVGGHGLEHWFPKFFYHGARYMQVECTGVAGGTRPEIVSLEAVVVHSTAEPSGEFECSNPLFNQIRQLVRWAQRSNMMSLMTDCPHRERLGWLEEDHLNGPSLRYEFSLAQLFTKAMNDMADSQLPNGLVPDIAPEYVRFEGGFVDSPEWGSAFVLVPWQQYQFTGDIDLLRRHYEAMKHYVDYLGTRANHYIVSHGLGDWYDIGPKPPGVAQLTPIALTATAFYYYDVWVLEQAAMLLGRNEEANQFRTLASEIREAFNAKFFKLDHYATDSQCANAVSLVMGLAPEEHRQSILESIIRDVRERGNALTAGDVGYRYLLRALAEGGRSDVLYQINNQSDKPGYGYQLRQGATSLTEAWDAGRDSSQNHFMLGQIIEWFYHDLAGIQCDETGPGFKKVLIRPALPDDLSWVRAAYNSVRGPIRSAWERRGSEFTLKISIPPNTTATVFVPGKSAAAITESGKPAPRAKGVRFARQSGDRVVFEADSGNYEFRSKL